MIEKAKERCHRAEKELERMHRLERKGIQLQAKEIEFELARRALSGLEAHLQAKSTPADRVIGTVMWSPPLTRGVWTEDAALIVV